MTDQELFEQKQLEASQKFWSEAKLLCNDLGVTEDELQLASLQVCGMPPWTALQHLINSGKLTGLPDLNSLSSDNLTELRRLAESLLAKENVSQLKHWMRKRSQELYVLDLQEFDWKRKDSEIELRFLVDLSKEQLRKTRTLTQTLANTILNAVKELNAMYKFTGNNFDTGKAKAVIFVGEDQLED